MEVAQSCSSELPKLQIQAEDQTLEEAVQVEEMHSLDRSEPIQEMDESQVPAVGESASYLKVEVEAVEIVTETSGYVKKKRGRPPRGQAKPLTPPPPKRIKEEDEDVCFICFDGGSLVLCDRRGCPKAYHPACIKRDEAFFRSKAKWNCGWHICSVCQKASHYMCYTCTYSLCKGCTKDADYLCVRGNKGFCATCMRTIMLIENNEQGNKEMVQVDFDDKSSWEYLFKVYWIYLKEKLSLTVNELTEAKNPWKMGCKEQSPDVHHGTVDGKGSSSNKCSEQLEANNCKRKKTVEDSLRSEKLGGNKGTSLVRCINWASKDLLEFVAHMKNGDASVLSQFDVQALLLEYIKRNNLRDPRQKSQIICDIRLKNLFGKPRVGHFEMLKLLEFHFLIKEDSQKSVFIPAGIVDGAVSHVEADAKNDNLVMLGKYKKRKTRRKGEASVLQPNLDEYAAIDVHNINLIFLRRNLMGSLVENKDKFHDKVAGSVVRIRISSSEQKQDMYRLVQVVGTSKVAVPYKLGNKTADVMLEVLNLDKKEAIPIDAISNQEFSEDECRRLRQSIKCGLAERLTVGKIQEKAMALQEVRLDNWLETEILRLNHLRDRASEKGHKKELREYVEKLQILKTPEERQRRLHDVPEVHVDPRMNPNYESEDNTGELEDKNQDEHVRHRYGGFSRNGSKPVTPQKRGEISSNALTRTWKNLTPKSSEGPTQAPTRALERLNENKDACGSNSSEQPRNQVDSSCSTVGCNRAIMRPQSFPRVASETSAIRLCTENAPSVTNSETEKLWHYQDPNGRIQGPFCMMQLRKWNTTGLFPLDMRIWVSDEKVDSILLTEALNGQFDKALPTFLQSQVVGNARDHKLLNSGVELSGSINTNLRDIKQIKGGNASVQSNGNNELIRSNGQGCQSLDWTTPVTSKEIQVGTCSRESLVGNISDRPQEYCPRTSSILSGQTYVSLSRQGRGQDGEREKYGDAHGTRVCQINGGNSHDNQCSSQTYSGQSSGQNWGSLAVKISSNNLGFNGFTSVAMSTDSSEQDGEMDIGNLPSPTPKTSDKEWEGQAAENKQSVSSDVPVQDVFDLPSPTPKPTTHEDHERQAAETNQSVPSNIPVQDSGPSWSSASNLVVGGVQLAEVADEWGGYSSAAKPSIEEWNSGLVSVSSLKPPEVVSDHVATPTSMSDQIIPSPSDPASNVSRWQPVVTERIEFSTLDEESVSDLLAEVDAMESRNGWAASPTSAMNYGDEFFQGSENDYFRSFEELSPAPDPAKSDALSSTGDLQLPSQSTMTDDPVGTSQTVLDRVNSSSGRSSTSDEVEDGETRGTHVSINLEMSHPDIQPPAPSTTSKDMVGTYIIPSAGCEAMDTGFTTMQENVNLGWGGAPQGVVNMRRNTGQATQWGNANGNYGALTGSSPWDDQRRYSAE